MRPVRAVRAWWGIVALAGGVASCETARNPGGIQRDVVPPAISLTVSQDTQLIAQGLSFGITASDNLGLKDIRLTYTGGYIAQTDTVFNTTVTSVTTNEQVTFPPTSGAGGFITIIGRATDGAGNFAEDTIVIFLDNAQALRVSLFAPATGALASSGKRITVAVSAAQAGGIQRIGFIIVPRGAVVDSTPLPINTADSVVFTVTSGFPDSTVYTDTLTVLQSTGTFTVTGFAVDVGGRRAVTSTVTVTVQSALNDVIPPVVSHTINARVETTDSIIVHATDPSGISLIGFQVDTSLTLTGAPLALVTVNVSAGNFTDVVRTLNLGLSSLITTFPTSVIVRGYACDLAVPTPNCGYSQTSTLITAAPRFAAPPRAAVPSGGIDTVVVVAGVTRTFPLGGKVADAIFNANQNELYLTNPPLHRVEIFQVANTTFVANPIIFGVGVPWGIALWPRDTLGNYGDSIVVADAGGTQLAIVDVRPGVRQLQWRQDLPNFLIETYKVVTNAGGGHTAEITVHDVSDRPQYVATVCRVTSGGTACAPDSIYAVYSTTPTLSSTSPFAGRATARMEKLINTSNPANLFGKLFWEIATSASGLSSDTLRVEEVRGRTSNVVLSACAGITVKIENFGLGDSTYTRNSGNFTHAFFGEGGTITTAFARVMAYSSKNALVRRVDPAPCFTSSTTRDSGESDIDFGMSPAVNVSDFISNTGIHVASIATNFNGRTNVVRADSIYYLDEFLRLKATSCTLAATGNVCVTGAPGMDMNYFHDFSPGGGCTPNCGSGTNKDNRLLFAARPDGNIDVFDTFDGSHLLDATGAPVRIPLRDPIIGPLRVARDAGGQLLFGITSKGLVMVRLPSFTNPNPTPRR